MGLHRAGSISREGEAVHTSRWRPAVYPFRYMATEGGLIAYGPEIIDQYRRAAEYVRRAAVLRDPATAAGIGQFSAIQAVAPPFGVELRPVDVRQNLTFGSPALPTSHQDRRRNGHPI
jgi:hypothetical protein